MMTWRDWWLPAVLAATIAQLPIPAAGQGEDADRLHSAVLLRAPLATWPTPRLGHAPLSPQLVIPPADRQPVAQRVAGAALASLILAVATVELLDLGCERLGSGDCDLPKLTLTGKLALGFFPLTILVQELRAPP